MTSSVFSRPYYISDSTTSRLLQALAFGLFVFLFLFFFRPFQIDLAKQTIGFLALGFGLITVISMILLNIIVPNIIPSFFDEQKWTVGREMLWTMLNILVIGLTNFLFYSFFITDTFSISSLLWFQAITLAVGIIPVTISVLLKEKLERLTYISGAEKMNSQVNEQKLLSKSQNGSQITIPSQNQGESLTLPLDDLIYIKAADNYIEVYSKKDAGTEKKLLRNYLKVVESGLEKEENIFRCHKSYLVNLQHLKHVSGNAQGYKLHLEGVDHEIPVSRSHNQLIRARFYKPSTSA